MYTKIKSEFVKKICPYYNFSKLKLFKFNYSPHKMKFNYNDNYNSIHKNIFKIGAFFTKIFYFDFWYKKEGYRTKEVILDKSKHES